MTDSRAASLIYALLAVLLTSAGWLLLFRYTRVDKLREKLEALRDRAFDAVRSGADAETVVPEATVTWIGQLARHADLFTAGRFLLACLAAGPAHDGASPAGTEEDAYAAEAAALVRRHLVWGCFPLALAPNRLLDNREVLRVVIASGTR